MTRGLNRVQMGLTEEMVEAYGETIWDLSHNIQVRVGDPVRELDWEQIEAQRDGAGLADVQIAERIGLTREQVTHIRLLLEHRKFQRHHYHRLYELGGGRRFRAERFVPVERRASLDERAMALRAALKFDPDEASRHIRTGRWGAATPAKKLRALAEENGSRLALDIGGASFDWDETLERALSLASGLAERGIGRGDTVAIDDPSPASLLLAYAAASLSSAVLCPVPDGLAESTLVRCLEKVSARASITGRGGLSEPRPPALETVAPIDDLTGSFSGLWDEDAVAGDPLAILFVGLDGGAPRAVVHNAHTLLAGTEWAVARFGLTAEDRIAVASREPHHALVALNLALFSGAALCGPDAGATVAVGAPLPEARLTLAADAGCRVWIVPEAQLALAASPVAPETLEPAPGVSLRLVAGDDEIVGTAGEGALELRGPNLAPSYLEDEAANRSAFTGDRWWRTGVRARIDEAGTVALLGGA
ncbi:MAG: class I adenylate-forming enzyme family protein [Defluviicoccus sp.]|nr:class I adenylate-forming enzyme family protein [Defluviicoccus sp.]MDE0279022.1 class I adenylate-forming enzyme family protein [Defluviicoccus sp.]